MNKPGTQFLSIGEAAAARRGRRHAAPPPAACSAHLGWPSAYASEAVRTVSGAQMPAAGKTVCYARVAFHDQRAQLQTQAARLERHCQEAGFANVGPAGSRRPGRDIASEPL